MKKEIWRTLLNHMSHTVNKITKTKTQNHQKQKKVLSLNKNKKTLMIKKLYLKKPRKQKKLSTKKTMITQTTSIQTHTCNNKFTLKLLNLSASLNLNHDLLLQILKQIIRNPQLICLQYGPCLGQLFPSQHQLVSNQSML